MSEIAKGVLGGAWTLLVGWILPSALNLAVFLLAVAPSLRGITLLDRLRSASGLTAGLVLLTAALLLGLVANACQNALYRLLEGYLLWPARAFVAGCQRSQRRKNFLADRLTVLRLERREHEQGPLRTEDAERLAQLLSNPGLARAAVRDRRRSAAQRALLRELLARFPISDDQIAPTRLGNAIRRFEEYGWDRYRLDTQLLWNELTGCVSDQVRRQSELARVSVDFFVALLFGHVAVGAAAALALLGSRPDKLVLLSTVVALAALVPLWYRSAVTATDEWAAAVRALVNTGRKPLADSLGLTLPKSLAEERDMWTMVSRLSRIPYHERAGALDRYRAEPTADPPAAAT
ncbi:hypothetical protein SAMN04487981_13559 [Streptomyces sp. cf386]|uniref:hypothetical protein n=1 Tax=Streptomyces sp. cf386 TaxID=1761904 RepID=UPI0008915C2C|nr:hypothetical protein [Streptomyces sp. cf386]SDP72928.1 hypothetical protein SAMN04487981_13559 [Streptomyces sp. cf386]